jgi:hypothetical protein
MQQGRGEAGPAQQPEVGLKRERVFVIAVSWVGKAVRELAGALAGGELRLYAAALVERYVKLGLERKVLADIRFNVFTISAPIAL